MKIKRNKILLLDVVSCNIVDHIAPCNFMNNSVRSDELNSSSKSFFQ